MSHARRVFVNFPDCASVSYGTTATLSIEDSRHFVTVLRLDKGAELTAIDRISAKEYAAILIRADAEGAEIQVLSERSVRTQHSRVTSVIFALAKGDKCDFVCEKLCELGVANIILWQSDRSVVRLHTKTDQDKKLARWQKITETAAKQSGNDHIPKVHLAASRTELFSILESVSLPNDQRLICSLDPEAVLPGEMLAPTGNLHLAVGPEGDFSPAEDQEFRARGFQPFSLGPLILRCETAAIVAVSMVHGAWGFQAS